MVDKIVDFTKAAAFSLGEFALTALVAAVLVMIATKIIRRLFRKYSGDQKAIGTRYTENLIRIALVMVACFWVLSNNSATASLGKALFQGTALVGVVAGFAAQPILSDLFCGLMLSTQKPFELGDRIELEDGTSGVVTDISIRHVTLRGLDTTDMVIPNSKLNAMRISNMSHGLTKRSFEFSINISYDSDVRTATEAVAEAVKHCPDTVPGKPGENAGVYGPVYFIAYDTSSLILRTTVYYDAKSPTEMVKSQVNLAVLEALRDKGIEIPYPYINVVSKEAEN